MMKHAPEWVRTSNPVSSKLALDYCTMQPHMGIQSSYTCIIFDTHLLFGMWVLFPGGVGGLAVKCWTVREKGAVMAELLLITSILETAWPSKTSAPKSRHRLDASSNAGEPAGKL